MNAMTSKEIAAKGGRFEKNAACLPRTVRPPQRRPHDCWLLQCAALHAAMCRQPTWSFEGASVCRLARRRPSKPCPANRSNCRRQLHTLNLLVVEIPAVRFLLTQRSPRKRSLHLSQTDNVPVLRIWKACLQRSTKKFEMRNVLFDDSQSLLSAPDLIVRIFEHC